MRETTDLDRTIGANVRLYRLKCGLAQEALAERIGVSCQQLQKYESGRNRISASRLYLVHKAMRVPLTKFFEE